VNEFLALDNFSFSEKQKQQHEHVKWILNYDYGDCGSMYLFFLKGVYPPILPKLGHYVPVDVLLATVSASLIMTVMCRVRVLWWVSFAFIFSFRHGSRGVWVICTWRELNPKNQPHKRGLNWFNDTPKCQ